MRWEISLQDMSTTPTSGGNFAQSIWSTKIIFVYFEKITYFVILVTSLFAVIDANELNQGGAYE
jgi:hypothetical protein